MGRAIDANVLADEIFSLRVRVTGLRAGKGALEEYERQYRESVLRIIDEQPTLPQLSKEPLTCEGCACEGYSRDSYPCNTCARNDETLADQYRPPEGGEDEDV